GAADVGPLAGRTVAVLGAGASGFDFAVHALREGAARVVLHARRPVLPRAEVLAWSNFPGFLTAFADLPDAERWRFMARMRELAPPPTQEMFDRAAADPRFELRLGSRIEALVPDGDAVRLVANGVPERVDRLLVATGYSAELEERPELVPLLPRIRRWRDLYAPPAGEEDAALGAYPYLGKGFELLAADPADAGFLGRVHLFNTGAVPSLGPVCNGVTGLKYGVPRVVDAIARDLFVEDSAVHYDRLAAFDEATVDASADRVAAIRSGLVPLAGSRVGVEARATVERLIAETRTMSAEFPGTLANHLPMVLEAMARLGASGPRLEAYFHHYNTEHAVPLLAPRGAPLTRETWRDALGDRDREADLRAFFDGEVRRLGGSGAIRVYGGDLSPGVAASALHGLMRLAYGVIRADEAEIAAALGYWAATFLPLRDEPAGPPDTDDPAVLALAMRADPVFQALDFDGHLLWHWMRHVGTRDAFAPLIGRLAVDAGTLDRVTAVSAALYAETMTFEALHAVTGSHWVRVVAPHFADPLALTKYFWRAILSVYPKIGMPLPASAERMAELRATTPPPDAEIAAAAVASDDEHDHSLVFSALQEFRRTADPLYRVLAARRVGLLP
ncbi:questin oxidase family protein, partial [Oharaeibacter diazotrophicus]